MYFRNWEELQTVQPVEDGRWNREILAEYLIWSCNRRFTEFVDGFMADYQKAEDLLDLLFEFLFNESYDGSDSQMGAARYIARMDRGLLRCKKDLLLRAQQNQIRWKRPFPEKELLDWL